MTATVLSTFEQDLTQFAFAINQLAEGRSNAVGTVTLAANVASTTVFAINCGSESVVLLMPKTANAAAAVATTYIATVSAGAFVISHANNVQTDRTFGYACLG